MNEWIQMICAIGCGGLVLYLLFGFSFGRREGLTNSTSGPAIGSATGSGSGGEAGSSVSYVAGLKAHVIQMQDELLISKYRSQYEDILISLDDYLGLMMLKESLHFSFSSDNTNQSHIANLANLKQAKDTLNVAMAFLDKH